MAWKFSLFLFLLTFPNSDLQGAVGEYSTLSFFQEDAIYISKEYRFDDNINMSLNSMNNGTNAVVDDWWEDLMIYTQLFLVILGFFANVATVITLFKNGRSFSIAILMLLRHQSAADATTCLFSAILIIQPGQPYLSNVYVIDLFICFFWYSQAMFWSCLYVSICNLIALAFERYLAVCHPFQHKELTPKKVRLMILSVYVFVAAVHWPNYFQSSLSDGVCKIVTLHESPTWLKIQYLFALSVFTAFYLVPCILFVILYGLVIFAFYKRSKQSELSASRIIDKATSELTKTAIVVTAIFMITMGLNLWYFMLGTVGVIYMEFYGFVHMFSLLLSSLNSTANPFVYSLLMPAYRKSVLQTFCFRN